MYGDYLHLQKSLLKQLVYIMVVAFFVSCTWGHTATLLKEQVNIPIPITAGCAIFGTKTHLCVKNMG